MKKYERHMVGRPRLQLPEGPWRDRVEEAKRQIREDGVRGASQLSNEWRSCRKEKKELEEQIESLNAEMEALQQLMADAFESEGISMVRFEDGASVGHDPQPYAAVEDPVRLREWAIEVGLGAQLTLPWQTVNSICKERLVNGLPEPPGVRVFVKSTSFTLRGERRRPEKEEEVE